MSGNQCSDIGGVSVPTPQGTAPLCVMPENHPYAGVVTYRDGRVVTLDPNNPGAGNFDVKKTNALSGTELGDCSARDNNKSLSFLQTTYKGSPVSWTAGDLKEVYRILGQAEGQTGNAYFCSNREDRSRVALNNDVAHQPSLRAAIETLQKNHGTLDDLHFNALLESLRTATGVPAPVDHTSDLVGVGLTFTLVAIVTGVVGFAAKGIWDKIFKGPKDGDGPKPPSGGGGGGGGKNFQELPTFAVNDLPAGADVQWPGGFVVKDGQVIGKAGKITREGVVTADDGALIYAPEYHAWIDGQIVALLPESGLQSLAGGNYTLEQFNALADGTVSSADDIVRSLNFKGPQAIATGTAVRLSSKDDAAAIAADRMRSGAQGHANGFGVSGEGIGVEVPVVRVAPVLVVP